ncbi:MAG: hypothetical protein E6I22_03075 [Chloroflexi bacterium]|nr:MAG: hypothetical protein E6I22_03075 [Chloroflexota bacterium]
MPEGPGGKLATARCSFCGKRQEQVRRLVAGPGVYICDQCIALSNQIMNEAPPDTPSEAASSKGKPGRPGRWRSKLFRFPRGHAVGTGSSPLPGS